jgi:hypothetical protein
MIMVRIPYLHPSNPWDRDSYRVPSRWQYRSKPWLFLFLRGVRLVCCLFRVLARKVMEALVSVGLFGVVSGLFSRGGLRRKTGPYVAGEVYFGHLAWFAVLDQNTWLFRKHIPIGLVPRQQSTTSSGQPSARHGRPQAPGCGSGRNVVFHKRQEGRVVVRSCQDEAKARSCDNHYHHGRRGGGGGGGGARQTTTQPPPPTIAQRTARRRIVATHRPFLDTGIPCPSPTHMPTIPYVVGGLGLCPSLHSRRRSAAATANATASSLSSAQTDDNDDDNGRR